MLPVRWGVAFALALIASGVVLVIVGSRALDSAADRRSAALYAGFIVAGGSSNGETSSQASTARANNGEQAWSSFANSSAFALAMDAPVFTSFYLWNLTNWQELLNGDARQPKVQQIGPYTYEQRAVKRDVRFNMTNDSFGTVSYRVEMGYKFVPERSNGSEMDAVVTVNASYVKRLTKLRARGYSERFLVAEYAHRHLREYTRHLRGAFIAQTKQRALRSFLPDLEANARTEALQAVISRQRARVDSSNIPSGLIKMAALAHTEQIPFVLRDVYKNISDRLIPGFLAKSYAQAKVDALSRVLSNMYERLQVEGVPSLLKEQLSYQRLVHVPRTLSSLWLHLERLASPYVMSEVFDRACLEAVPFVLRSIKSEIVARNIANNQVAADEARFDVVELWRLRSSQLTDFDAWIDDSPTGSPRTGFELLPIDSTLQLSSEVATLLLGSKSSNLRFSIVDYDDAQSAAALAMDTPASTPEGFAIWKQVIAMNETAIAYVLEGVSNDVALSTDYLTRAQLLYVRDYLMTWASSTVVQRDRQRFWRAPFARRTSNSDVDDPDVDLDYEQAGTQSGFSLVSVGASCSVTTSVARQLWNTLAPLSIATPAGFTKWLDILDTSGGSSATQVFLDGITGITSAQVTEVTSWIAGILSDGFIARRALRHWSNGTCQSVLRLDLSSCLRYDLEPLIPGDQLGFEMNPSSEPNISVSQTTRELLWGVVAPSSGPSASFLVSTHPSDATTGFGLWMRAIRTSNVSTLVDFVQQSDFTDESASAIADWLSGWGSASELNSLVVHNWWTKSVCWPRETLSVASVTTVISTSQPTCDASYVETEVSSVVTATSEDSPFVTFEKSYQVDQLACEFDSTTSTYTSNHTTYSTDVREYSCDAISTSLAGDEDELTFGFELSPLVTSVSDRVPLAAALELWDPDSTLSFLNLTGFHRWFQLTDEEEGQAVVADTAATILTELNERVATICTDGNVGGGGVHSSIFNASISDAACSSVTSDHVDLIAAWVRSQMRSQWVRNSLLDQWRRGSANDFDIEPYRPKQQSGLELECGCTADGEGCSLSSENGTRYVIPREAMQFWDADTNSAFFLTYAGAALWEQLSIDNATGDATTISTAQNAIVSASGVAQWEQWMDRVFEWLESWKHNEHLVRDVVGHWLYAQCPTTPATLRIVNEAAPVTSTQATCPSGGASEYSIRLNDTVLELQDTASRPTRFFDAEVVDNAASVQPRKVVEATETWISCEEQTGVSPTAYTETIVVIDSVKEYQACNLLRVLASAPIASLPVSPIDDLFELNSSNTSDALVTTPDITIPVAVRLWETPSDFSVASVRSFVDRWFFAIDDSDRLHSLEDELNALVDESEASNLTAMQQYLVRWESSELMAEEMGEAWLSTAVPLQDLDPATDGIQSGLELRSSREYVTATTAEAMPTLAQAKHLWNAKNQFSFLHTGDASGSGLPVGFNAWKELYEGVDFSSEKLVDQYPLKPVTERKSSMTYTLTSEQRDDLLDEIMADTSLTAAQVRGIASWVLTWANRLVLQDYVLFQWATGKTPRGSSTGRLSLADHLERLYNLTDSGVGSSASARDDLFTVGSELLSTMAKPQLRSLWALTTNGSLVNPASRVLWCTAVHGESDLDAQVAKYCPHILDDFGAVTEAALEDFERS